MKESFLKKYNVPGPRYTSYPTVPYWDVDAFSIDSWRNHLGLINHSEGVSIYIHLPYCESLCTYCGCTTRITKNHAVEDPYVEALLKEWNMYCSMIGSTPEIKELHLGGGTPTFFSPKNLNKLLGGLVENNTRLPEISVEAHPNNTNEDHLNVLNNLGCHRLSLGIQDFNKEVQKLINRHQSFETVDSITKLARSIGYKSINYDLIYGLPGQSEATVRQTIESTIRLRPDRIAFYSYAHVPWMKRAQKSFEDKLPKAEEKRKLYELGKKLLTENGYVEIGMDHFALENDALTDAFKNGTLHRNFMGYTTQKTNYIIGLGVSSISDLWSAFAQNEKKVEDYLALIEKGKLPIERGHLLTDEDLKLRQHILNIMCRFHTSFTDDIDLIVQLKERLSEMETDGLVYWEGSSLSVTEAGVPYVRNVCMSLDQRLLTKKPETQLFSQTV
ncbi:MAG: oxygen-independent coproporphyrinogen III oxidase [Cytophagales bacterium]|nr:oxygen-independent coproporphyrinogen III oxidase [Cytophagales bacterium]